MIPSFDDVGVLPDGLHDCTIEEVGERFGRFQTSDRRLRLWGRLHDSINEAKTTGLIDAVLVDGSFVTATDAPNDIDLLLVVSAGRAFSVDLAPAAYNLLSQRYVRRHFGFDIVVVQEGSQNFDQAVSFFRQVKQRPGILKGLLRIKL